jgi:AcrR family transcriptional regulator
VATDAGPAAAPCTAPAAAPVDGRRARHRQETLRELSEAALAEVREHGAVELSLRRVARRMGMSPAGLYRYVGSREELLTRMITEAYDDLADHLAAATCVPAEPRPGRRADQPLRSAPAPPVVAPGDADVADRVRAVGLAYRHWGVTHPHEFGLIYGEPIPGYAAPPGGVTVDAMSRVGDALGRPLVEAWEAGRLRTSTGALLAAELRERLTPMAELAGRPIPPELALTLLTVWGRLHGQVSLEVFGHHRWLFPDGCEALFTADLDRLLVDLAVVEVDDT